jgi:hypothetical protein
MLIMNNTADQEQTLSTIRVMRRQEETSYANSDYLESLPDLMSEEDQDPIDAACRSVMSQWCYQIVDFCSYKRETVATCMSNLDRFLATPDGQQVMMDRNQFQLAAMTSLYTAVKVHEQEAMAPKLISSLSRGAHSIEAVEAMEFRILSAIQWRVNPPTAMAFVRNFLDLVSPHALDDAARATVMDLTQYQTELAVGDYDFIIQNPSAIAFASMLNALESIGDQQLVQEFDQVISHYAKIDSSELQNLRICLYEAISQVALPQFATPQKSIASSNKISAQSCIHTSPRSVSQ